MSNPETQQDKKTKVNDLPAIYTPTKLVKKIKNSKRSISVNQRSNRTAYPTLPKTPLQNLFINEQQNSEDQADKLEQMTSNPKSFMRMETIHDVEACETPRSLFNLSIKSINFEQ